MKRRAEEGGFTLIEIIVVMAIVALASTLAIGALRNLRRADLRSSSAHLSGAIRYLFDRASTTGKIHRLVLDFNDGKYWAEVSDDLFFMPHDAETERELRKREDKEAAQDEETRRKIEERARMQANGNVLSQASSYDPSKLDIGDFQPKRARFAAFKDMALKPVPLKKVKLRSVYTPRVVDPVTSGRAYIYFFPLGQTEPAIVTLSDKDESSFYSLVVHPLTGRVQIYNQEIAPPRTQTDDEGNRTAP
jgi:general secretion pathway protein H